MRTRIPSGRMAVVVLVLGLGLAIAALVVVAVVRRDPYRPGTTHAVQLHMTPGCANPEPVVLDDRAWDTKGLAPVAWPAGSTHGGRLVVVAVDGAMFTADDDPNITIPFHRERGPFTELYCMIR